MKLGTVLLLKLALQGITLFLLLPWMFRVSFGMAALTAVILWVGSLLIGDLGVLARMGQAAAAVTDFILVAAGVMLLLGVGLTWKVLLVAVIVTIEEALLHPLMVFRGIAGHPGVKH
jgi:hypothetical protein